MSIQKHTTSEPGTTASPTAIRRRPTLQAWVALQPAWLLAGLFAPHNHLAIYSSLPLSLLIAWAASRWNMMRTPTWMGICCAFMAYLSTVVLGVHHAAAIAFDQADDKLVVTGVIMFCYLVREVAAKAPDVWNAAMGALAVRLWKAMRANPPAPDIAPAK